MKVLVLGGSGYIGQRLLQRMESYPEIEAVAASRGYKRTPANVRALKLDSRDPHALSAALQGMDCLINCVAGDADSIATGAQALVESANRAHLPRLIHLSTMSVYGRQEGRVDEGARFDPELGWYAEAKCEAESLLGGYARQGGDLTIFRPGCVYGPHSYLWVDRIGQLLQAGRLGDLGGNGDGWSNLVHIDDVCTAILNALLDPCQHPGRTVAYNLAAPDSPRWNEYFRDLAIAIGATPLRRVSSRQTRADACIAGPLLKIAEKVADRLKLSREKLPVPFPPALLRFFAQQIRLDSHRAEHLLCVEWTPYASGLAEAAAALNSASTHSILRKND